MKNIYLLGATGSIGMQTLEIIKEFGNEYRLVSIAAGENIKQVIEILENFDVKYVSLKCEADALKLKDKYPKIIFGFGSEGLINASTFSYYNDGENVVINALVGMVGLVPTIHAIKAKRTILIANKETLVVGGEIITKYAKQYGVKLLPIDSEHSAIMQCLEGRKKEEVKRIIITASGGAFRDKTREQLEQVTINDALRHPNWSMGKKITVDCATMVNKGLEVIEAHYLFDMPYEKIDTIIHRQSIVHSMVEYIDNTVIAQMGKADMRIPIQYALTYPKKCNFTVDSGLKFTEIEKLTFEEMDFSFYPALLLAYKVGKMGGIMPAVYNAANEAAVKLFMENKIKFLDIEKIILYAIDATKNIINPTLDEILNVSLATKENILKKYQ